MANTEIDSDAFQKAELQSDRLRIVNLRGFQIAVNFTNGAKQQDDLTAVIIERV